MLTRRRFVRPSGIGAAGAVTGSWISARGREDSLWSRSRARQAQTPARRGCQPDHPVEQREPARARARRCSTPSRPRSARPARRPAATRARSGALIEALAKQHNVQPANIALGCGSTQILRTATHVFTARNKALVGTIPTYEECAGYADMMGHPVRAVPLDPNFNVDLDRIADAARGAGLVFFCNPNNPVATYIGARATRDFLARVNRISPETTILVDEAYFDYVTHPDHATHIPLAIEDPRIVVARTFSKAYGMAGLRIGYAVGHADAIRKMNDVGQRGPARAR